MSIFLKRIQGVMNRITRRKLKYCSKTARIDYRLSIYNPNNLVLGDNTMIDRGTIIMNPRAKFIMKRNSGAAFGLSVITGNHMTMIGKFRNSITDDDKNQMDPDGNYDRDVIVEEDVWLGCNVTLLSGAHIGRGATIGASGVIRGNIPPYAITMGNPAKIVGFCFKPEEIIEHEKALYPEDERLPLELLEKNYNKYFLGKLGEIRKITNL